MEGILLKAVWVYLAANGGIALLLLVANHWFRYKIFGYYGDEHQREMSDKIKEQDNRLDTIEEVQQKRSPNYGKIEALERKDEDIDRRITELADVVEKEVNASHDRDEKNEAATEELRKQMTEMNNNLIKINTTLEERLPKKT